MHQVNSYIKKIWYIVILFGASPAFCSQIPHKKHKPQQNIAIRDEQKRQYSLNEQISLNTRETQKILQSILEKDEPASLNEINRATGYAINCLQVTSQLSKDCSDKEQKDDFELQKAQLEVITAQLQRKFVEKIGSSLNS